MRPHHPALTSKPGAHTVRHIESWIELAKNRSLSLLRISRASSQAVSNWVADVCVALAAQIGMHNATVDETCRLVDGWLAKNRAA